ncbi:MAG: polysaccharide biosynthesis protein [Pirellulales bacterium]
MNTLHFRQPFSKRVFAFLVLHAVVFALSYFLAFLVRLDWPFPDFTWTLFWITLPMVVVIKLTLFHALGQCHSSWLHLTFADLARLLGAASLASMAIATADYFGGQNYHVPRGILLLDWGITIFLLGGLRALPRLALQEIRPLFERKGYRRALVVGANAAGESLTRQIHSDPLVKYLIVGYLDDDLSRHGTRLGGVPVLGRPDDAPKFATSLGAEDVLVISGNLPGKRLRALMRRCEESGLKLRVLPAVDELLHGAVRVQVRDVEINDLLGRDAIELNCDAIEQMLAGRTVLVTGAGGSIGSEICRQVLRFHPQKLVLLERGENSLFLMERELRSGQFDTALCACVADIRDEARLAEILQTHRPDVIFHAAAFKHVPLMEDNPGEAIKNNVLGTRQLVEMADHFGVGNFVMISTDKAVNPSSIMGVSKHLAERFVHAFAETSATKYVVVRFGNVLASAGSVVPIFQEQIRRGGPVTVTHPEIERFFMTIPEASQLVLQAAAMGGAGQIFVLDMGDPVKIVDLARDLIRLSGFKPDEDIEIVFSGLRPGEKLYEELYFDSEEKLPTPHPKVFVAYHRPYALEDVTQSIEELGALADGPMDALLTRLKEIVPEYAIPTHVIPQREAAANGAAIPNAPAVVDGMKM